MSVFYMAMDTIKIHEGLRTRLYTDSTGHLTIGYGRNLSQNPISIDEAELMLKNDINAAINELEQIPIYRELDQVRQTVLVDMCYNLGLPRLMQFKKMWAALKLGKYDLAANEMLNSRWANQVKGRAYRLSELMRLGVK